MNDECKGIVISFREYRENDAMLHVLSEDGMLYHMIAKGIQKVKSKNAPACQLFTYTRFQLNIHENSDLQTLRSAEILDSFRLIREDLYKQSIAAYVCECINSSGFEENVFPLLYEVLHILKESKHPLRILCLFQSIVNRLHGIEPYVDGCVRCGNTVALQAISTNSGGMICSTCYQSAQDKLQSISELKKFRLLCKADLQHYEIIKNYADFNFSDFLSLYNFFYDYAGVSVKSIRFLKHLYAMEENLK